MEVLTELRVTQNKLSLREKGHVLENDLDLRGVTNKNSWVDDHHLDEKVELPRTSLRRATMDVRLIPIIHLMCRYL